MVQRCRTCRQGCQRNDPRLPEEDAEQAPGRQARQQGQRSRVGTSEVPESYVNVDRHIPRAPQGSLYPQFGVFLLTIQMLGSSWAVHHTRDISKAAISTPKCLTLLRGSRKGISYTVLSRGPSRLQVSYDPTYGT